MKKPALLFAICHLSFTLATAQTQLSQYQPGVTTDGAVYFLPKTVVKLQAMVEKTTYTPGDFARYAQRYLRMSDVSQEPAVSYRLLGVRITPVAVPDTTKGYAVKFNPKTVAPHVALSADGLLLAINAEPRPDNTSASSSPVLSVAALPQPDPRKYMSEEILSAGSTAKMAELTAREIYDLRENRSLLIKGQADFMPTDGTQLRLMLSQLDQQDRALSSLFTGVTRCDTTESVVTIVCDGPIQRQLAFRLSRKLGLVDNDDLAGVPYYINIEDMHTVPLPDKEAAAKVKKKAYEAGIYVNVPGTMRVTLQLGDGQTVSTAELPAPQFGNVELLSGDLFNKHFTTHLWLNPLTGAVERLETEQPR